MLLNTVVPSLTSRLTSVCLSCSFPDPLVTPPPHCHWPLFMQHWSFAPINYTEHNQSVYEAKVSVVRLIQAVTDGGRSKSHFASCSSQLAPFFSSFFFFFLRLSLLKMAAITECIMGQYTQSAKDICSYKGTHIAAVPGIPPSCKVLGGRVKMWDCKRCGWLEIYCSWESPRCCKYPEPKKLHSIFVVNSSQSTLEKVKKKFVLPWTNCSCMKVLFGPIVYLFVVK